MDPTSKTPCFFFNQTLGSVVAGERHPQPHYQTATQNLSLILYIKKLYNYNSFSFSLSLLVMNKNTILLVCLRIWKRIKSSVKLCSLWSDIPHLSPPELSLFPSSALGNRRRTNKASNLHQVLHFLLCFFFLKIHICIFIYLIEITIQREKFNFNK